MKKMSFTIGLCCMVISLMVLAACTPASGNDIVTLNEDGRTNEIAAGNGEPSDNSGQSEPGGEGGITNEQASSTKPTVAYLDAQYNFAVEHPSDFVLRNVSAEQLGALIPKPAAAILFMDPVIANSEVPDEPGDLEIRIYALEGAGSLESWLKSAGLTISSTSQEAFKTGNVTGLKLCESTMIFPGCRYYVFGKDWVYQLTTTTQEGEYMFNSFILVQENTKSSKPTVVYQDEQYKFSIVRPSDFVLRKASAEQLGAPTPKPAAAILFMDPVIAKSEVPDEPGDLEIRIYALEGTASLENWLKSSGLAGNGSTLEAFKTGTVSGIKLCAATMLFPACRYYVFGTDWVYQLTVTTQEGVFMFNSFKLVQ